MSRFLDARGRIRGRRRRAVGRAALAGVVGAASFGVGAAATDVISTEDITPPDVVSVELDTTSVDVTSAGAYINAVVHATDDLSGFQRGWVQYRNHEHNRYLTVSFFSGQRVSGDGLDGTYETRMWVPATTVGGEYSLSRVYAIDVVGNFVHDLSPDPGTAPPSINVVSSVELDPPSVTSLTVLNPAIDVTTELATVGIEMVATDEGSGIRSASVGFQSPSRRQYASATLLPVAGETDLLRGAALVAAQSEPGEWTLSSVCAVDQSNNAVCWSQYSNPTAAEVFGEVLHVTSDAADAVAPEVGAFRIEPGDIDVTRGPESVAIDFDVSDVGSGVAYAYMVMASPRTVGASPEVINRFSYAFAPTLYTTTWNGTHYEYQPSGNAPMLDGTVRGRIVFPQYDRSGDWTVTAVCVVDNVNWRTCYGGEDIAALGPATLGVEWNRTPVVTVTGVDQPTYPAGGEPTPGCAVSDLEDGVIEDVVPEVSGPDVAGVVTVTCSYTDSGGITGTGEASYVIESDSNPPTLTGAPDGAPNANGWYRDDVTIVWTASDAESGIDPGTMPSPSVINGDGVDLTALASVSDLAGNATSATSAPPVSIDSTPPTAGEPTLSENPLPLDAAATMSVAVADELSGVDAAEFFVDSDPREGAGTPMMVSAGVATADVGVALTPGVYSVFVRSLDRAGNWSAPSSTMLVVYDPSGGFVTGGGWIDSPVGSHTDDVTTSGPARFGFVAKYKRGATVPDGNTEFHFQAADLRFSSTSYDWLVVSGNTARYMGEGQLGGADGFTFMMWACDVDAGGTCSGHDFDTVRMQIWETDTEHVVYDSAAGGDSATPLSHGSIKVHTGK